MLVRPRFHASKALVSPVSLGILHPLVEVLDRNSNFYVPWQIAAAFNISRERWRWTRGEARGPRVGDPLSREPTSPRFHLRDRPMGSRPMVDSWKRRKREREIEGSAEVIVGVRWQTRETRERRRRNARVDLGHLGPRGYSIYISALAIFSSRVPPHESSNNERERDSTHHRISNTCVSISCTG